MKARNQRDQLVVGEFIRLVRALPERERAIYVAITFLEADPNEIAAAHGLTTDETLALIAAAVDRAG